VEELDGLRDDVFHSPPSGIVAHNQFNRSLEVIEMKKVGFSWPFPGQ